MQIFIPTTNLRFVVRKTWESSLDLSDRYGNIQHGREVHKHVLQQQWRADDDPLTTEWRDVPTEKEEK